MLVQYLMIDTFHKQLPLQSALFVIVTDSWSLIKTVLFNPMQTIPFYKVPPLVFAWVSAQKDLTIQMYLKST